MGTVPKTTVIDRVLDVLQATADGRLCSADTVQQAHDDLEKLRDDVASINLSMNMLEISPTGDDYNEVIDLLEVDYNAYPLASAKLLLHEVSYAYPGSAQAQQLGHENNGCYVLNAKGKTRAFESLAMAMQCTVALGTRPRRWSVDHPANRHFTAFDFDPA